MLTVLASVVTKYTMTFIAVTAHDDTVSVLGPTKFHGYA
jgi:hypothetical protein